MVRRLFDLRTDQIEIFRGKFREPETARIVYNRDYTRNCTRFQTLPLIGSTNSKNATNIHPVMLYQQNVLRQSS